MSQAIYRKWRPARFDDVIGQSHVTQTLQRALASDRVGHAYLFCGPRGTGKTTTARLLAKGVNCLNPDPAQRPDNSCAVCKAINEGRYLDLIEIDAASNTGVDDIRELRDRINFAPSEGRFKVYIIDEVHMLSTAAFNALLKTLEEPPPHALFILATTEEHKVLPTIKSRCQQFNFRLLTVSEIGERLEWLIGREHLNVESQALQLIAREGNGSIRDAESLLDQLISVPGEAVTLAQVEQMLGAAPASVIAALVDAWIAADARQGLAIIHEALNTGADTRQFCRQMVAYLRSVLLLQTVGDGQALDLPIEQQQRIAAQAARASRRGLIDALKLFNEVAMSPANSWQPQLPLELAFIETLPTQPMGGATTWVAPQPAAVAPMPRPSEPPALIAAKPEVTIVDTAAEPPAPEQVVDAEPATAVEALSLDEVRAVWSKLVRSTRQYDHRLPAALPASKPLHVEGDTVILGFDWPLVKEQRYDNIPGADTMVGQALSEILGRSAKVRSVISSNYTPPPTPMSRSDFEELAKELGGVVVDE